MTKFPIIYLKMSYCPFLIKGRIKLLFSPNGHSAKKAIVAMFSLNEAQQLNWRCGKSLNTIHKDGLKKMTITFLPVISVDIISGKSEIFFNNYGHNIFSEANACNFAVFKRKRVCWVSRLFFWEGGGVKLRFWCSLHF